MLDSHMRGRIASISAASVFVAAIATPALAHHPMGGAMPSSFVEGLLSGIGHPIIGIDHLAFIIGVGIASAFLKFRHTVTLAFIGATIIGCLMTVVFDISLPFREFFIVATVVLIGILVMSGRSLSANKLAGVFALAGLFHGAAYAGAVIGAESTPILAYLVGFSFIQLAIATAAGWAIRELSHATDVRGIEPRLVGAVVMGIGVAFMIENVEKVIFPGL